MDIEGNVGHLTAEEQAATGYGAELMLDEIETVDLLDDVQARLQALEHGQAADDDELTQSERAAIGPELMWQMRRYQLITKIAGQVGVYNCEEFLKRKRR